MWRAVSPQASLFPAMIEAAAASLGRASHESLDRLAQESLDAASLIVASEPEEVDLVHEALRCEAEQASMLEHDHDEPCALQETEAAADETHLGEESEHAAVPAEGACSDEDEDEAPAPEWSKLAREAPR